MGSRRSLSATTAPPGASTAGRMADSSPPSRPARRYGGARKTRSYCSPPAAAPPRKRSASERRTCVLPRVARSSPLRSAPSASRLERSARSAAGAESTKVAAAAPRESASMPSAPLPANRSSTRASGSRATSTENSASRTRSEVGRVAAPGGATSRRPPHSPAITRTGSGQCREQLRRDLLLAAHHAGQVDDAVARVALERSVERPALAGYVELRALVYDVGDHQRGEHVSLAPAHLVERFDELLAALAEVLPHRLDL